MNAKLFVEALILQEFIISALYFAQHDSARGLYWWAGGLICLSTLLMK